MQFLLTLLIPLLAAFWVFIDAKDKGRPEVQAFLWAFGTFMVLIIFLPLWLFFRTRYEKEKKGPDVRYCHSCSRSFKYIPDAQFCPFCGQRLNNHQDIEPKDIEYKRDLRD